MIVAIIPARGGSKRIPRKNIRPFAGKPMIAYSIAAARGCALFDRIIVSTEDEEIAEVARSHGAETPFSRPQELADDSTGDGEVIDHALRELAHHGQRVDFACCVYATAPFLSAEDLRRGFDLLKKNGRRFTFAATAFPSRIQRAIRLLPGGGIAPFFPQWIQSRSQDLEDAYLDAGQFYWADAEAWQQRLPFYEAHTEPVILPRHRVQDIDTLEDWAHAELMYRAITLA